MMCNKPIDVVILNSKTLESITIGHFDSDKLGRQPVDDLTMSTNLARKAGNLLGVEIRRFKEKTILERME